MEPMNQTEWEILNATADAMGNLEQIEDRLRSESRIVPLPQVADAIHALVERGLLAPRWDEGGQPSRPAGDLGYVRRAWFVMTPRGREAWASSAPTTPPGRLHFGVWNDLAVDIPLEEFQAVRREMSKDVPREFPE